MNGFLNIYKPCGMSSSDVVVKVKKRIFALFGDKKIRVGHLGTLDPAAEGVLVVAVGTAARLFDRFLKKRKLYRAEVTFGIETDTLDREGTVVRSGGKIPEHAELVRAAKSLTGEVFQMPPQYSAKSVGGVRAYQLARQGETVELSPKKVTISGIDILSYADGVAEIEVDCLGGVYIRSIARDLGAECGTFAYMSRLTRLQAGAFKACDAVSLEEFLGRDKIDLIPTESALTDIPRYDVADGLFGKLDNGVKLSEKELLGLPVGEFRIYAKNRLFGIGKNCEGMLEIETRLWEEEKGELKVENGKLKVEEEKGELKVENGKLKVEEENGKLKVDEKNDGLWGESQIPKIISFGEKVGEPLIVVLGYMDCVHIGHRSLICEAKAQADKNSVKTAVVTFANNPYRTLGKDILPVYDFETRLRYFETDYVLCAEFDEEFRRMTGEAFLDKLFDGADIRGAVVGEDYRFSAGAAWGIRELREYLERRGVPLFVCGTVKDGGEKIGSSRIRAYLTEGNIEGANRLLGRSYFVSGRVIRGTGTGAAIGFPTANIEPPTETVRLKEGVYLTRSRINGGEFHPSVTNAGARPTFSDEGKYLFESYIDGISGEQYGKLLEIEFLERIRDVVRFDTKEELVKQLKSDAERIKLKIES
ncbi:MAG: tRNA pseudouridine(55) synthase TruB [Clostridiales bacterium]|jgi:tRNA pseudouridine55 synthase|nr:tRNA pseudouridine(55) synthase TruB [Clostridiales bacterium]